MNGSYVASLAIFVVSLVAVATLWGLFLPWVAPLPLVILALGIYAAGVLLDVMPPGKPRRLRTTDHSSLDTQFGVVALAALVGVMVVSAVLATRDGGDGTAAAGPSNDDGGADVTSPTAEPTDTPAPTPTATPEPLPTPQVPARAFEYCTRLYADNYTCGEQPWRVICTPDGYFFDPEGVIPRPIPEEWEGWSETTLTGRLEYIHGACD